MCTVTFLARRRGYCLGMNRDEKRTRAPGRPPKEKKLNDHSVVFPSEPGGGTWIAVNDHGVTFALINWYTIKTRVGGETVSRGGVVHSLSAALSPKAAGSALPALPLQHINPFRLIGVFPLTREVVEWRWDLRDLVRKNHRWTARQWISSGFDEPTAQRVRGATFRRAHRQATAGSVKWLRRLHCSHSPDCGAFSTCMHRADAATVSYTEINVSSRDAILRYHAGWPCQHAKTSICRLRLKGA